MPHSAPEVVIIGGGFGGLNAARSLHHAPVHVTLIDRRNFHLFQPLLYQVATGQLSPANIAAPLRSVLRRQSNCRVLLGEVVDLDVANRRVRLADGEVPFDILVLATGSTHHYFGHPEWESPAPGLKTIEDATEIRRRVLRAFEAAERDPDPSHAQAAMTFVVVGGGPTGVEMAGTLCELARQTLRHDFRAINPAHARVLLIEGADRVLPSFRPPLSERARRALERLNVEVWTKAIVTDIRDGVVTVKRDGAIAEVPTHTVVWAAGVQASPLGRTLAQATGAAIDRQGRVLVQPDLTVPGHPEIFVIGDLAAVPQRVSQRASAPPTPGVQAPAPPTLPGVAPVAIQQGRYVADAIRLRLRGTAAPPFHYHDKGSLATIGRASAVADLGWIWFSGYTAWLAWLFVHILYLIGFTNRLLVVTQWAWSYFTRGRTARLITGEREHPIRLVAGENDASSADHR
jgi:NADH dehydrogenase